MAVVGGQMEIIPGLTNEHFQALMGAAGLVSGLVVMLIWSRGL
jgi:hypothetical protein